MAVAVYELVLGTALLFAPWSHCWRESWLLWRISDVAPWVMGGPMRGAVSGVGAAFLLLGFQSFRDILDKPSRAGPPQ